VQSPENKVVHQRETFVEIRKDFASASEYLERLVQYASAFSENNLKSWPHYKNKEDFARIHLLDWSVRKHFEKIYSTGRDCAIALSERLIAFNYPDQNPTLTDFIKSLEGGWLYEFDDLRDISSRAKEAAKSVEHCPWAVEQMISLYDDQLRLVEASRNTIELLKQTKLYKIENGLVKVDAETDTAPWWKSFDRRIAIVGLSVAVLGLAISLGLFR
jgi:hypothetical protein